jgi:hypothetical protein
MFQSSYAKALSQPAECVSMFRLSQLLLFVNYYCYKENTAVAAAEVIDNQKLVD